ncbi:hypothetical protein [Pontibacter akesuensis]|uniref:hypothetical protein n=1 Tax=Pontibacter akesuensis TaxID=388950 RepID=UPI0012FBEC3B|nr:hypothetical protein [Pontibacter akesuensis]
MAIRLKKICFAASGHSTGTIFGYTEFFRTWQSIYILFFANDLVIVAIHVVEDASQKRYADADCPTCRFAVLI